LQLIFKRRLTSEALTTFFPSVLLIAITYATTFLKPVFFEAALTVNLTVMLVITTLFISVVDKMAPTSYIKWMEIWLIFAQLVPFTEVILLTIQERYRKDEEETGNEQERKEMKPEKNWTKIMVNNVVVRAFCFDYIFLDNT
jgi:hypothetical protein